MIHRMAAMASAADQFLVSATIRDQKKPDHLWSGC
jgi:hypothetical protein